MKKHTPRNPSELRRQAESLVRERAVRTPEDGETLSPEEIRQTLHELRVHQIELEMQNEELRAAQEEIATSRARYFDLYDLAPVGYCTLSKQGVILEANLTAATLLGMTRDLLVKKPISSFIIKDDQDIYYLHRKKLFDTGEPQEYELRMVKPDGACFWAHLTGTAVQAEDGAPVCRVVISDITERKRSEEERKKIEWMLASKPPVFPSISSENDIEDQGYGDLTVLNRSGLISHSIDKDTLKDISTEYLNLLETSSAIYEKNGDYAYGIFCSAWCRLMDGASRKLCHTEDNEAALVSGEWLCHESCWTDCSKRAIESRSPVDIECKGGIHLYAAPIFSAGEVIGAINFGYGDPPKDAAKLRSLAEAYGLDPKQLAREADAFASRPAYIIELAKQRLLSSARLIGIMVERKQAEEALRETAERLRLANKATNDVIWDWDVIQDTQRWNEAGTAVFGWTEIVERPVSAHWWIERVHPDDRERVHDSFFAVVNNPELYIWHDEYRFKKADGVDAYVQDRGYMLRDDQGKAIRMIGAMQDVTERKQAEEEREKLQTQLAQAQKMESVGRLAGGVAHDFNNMLNVILGHAELSIEQVDTDAPLYSSLVEIRNAALRSADLTRQLLAFARKQTVAPKVIDLNDTLEGMLKMLRRLIGEDIDLVWSPGRDLWPVKMDPSQIDQILANLCVNARDAIAGVGRVTIETNNRVLDEAYCADHADYAPGEYVRLAISDDGRGMDKETLTRIFEPFYTTKEQGKGTGLGLATVYGIVKQNNGVINVYSEPGAGTTFTIYLWRHEGEAGHSIMDTRNAPSQRGDETILLVEDEPSVMKLATMMLERLGYTVFTASTPAEAIRLAGENAGSIRLLITDVIMPGMNGRDLAITLQSICPHLRKLFISGYTANVIAHHGVLDEGVHFIQKPFSRLDLASRVREALDG